MFEWLSTRILRVLRVPAEPSPPAGAPGSVRVFRAGKNYYRLRVARWSLGQLAALVGILFSVGLLLRIEHDVAVENAAPPAPATLAPTTTVNPGAHPRRPRNQVTERDIARVAARAPWWVFPLLTGLKLIGILTYLAQIPVTYAALRLEYEQRWYIVTDRSLRIRSGLARVQELTMSFANIQQVVVTRGPIQGLLGIADVRVQSAGGAGAGDEKEHYDPLHTGIFHGVDNALEIRDLILERLRQFRAAGLGDPDDHRDTAHAAPAPTSPVTSTALAAALELLEETRALRRVLRG